jgi:hypothetical protein
MKRKIGQKVVKLVEFYKNIKKQAKKIPLKSLSFQPTLQFIMSIQSSPNPIKFSLISIFCKFFNHQSYDSNQSLPTKLLIKKD